MRGFPIFALTLLVACGEPDKDTDATATDTGAEDCTDPITWYRDADGDGWGTALDTVEACDQPSGYVDQAGDDDDNDQEINPDAEESCDGIDNDCDGEIDEDAEDAQTWYADLDGDGWGSEVDTIKACQQPTGYLDVTGDHDDHDASINPGADEICDDGIDNDCDGQLDEEDCVEG